MKNYFGDVIVFESKTLESRLVTMVTGNKYNHSAMRVSENYAKNITKREVYSCDLNNPEDKYLSYLILEHKDINDSIRHRMMEWNNVLSEEYCKETIARIGRRYLTGKKKDNTCLSTADKLNCSSRIALIYHNSHLSILDNIHWSQIEPNDFFESHYFKVVREWKR